MSDKLDHAITFKTTEKNARHIAGLAMLDGMDGTSEWVRHVVHLAIEQRKKQCDALNSIFGSGDEAGKVNNMCRGVPASRLHGPQQ